MQDKKLNTICITLTDEQLEILKQYQVYIYEEFHIEISRSEVVRIAITHLHNYINQLNEEDSTRA